ncbi:beta-lactamase class A [Pseudoxanthomonas wuyuanensis]|uniref:Beta-lactamase class A n=1 Tax=Pseudoxanthomonas wuyuanensis TaxID=1073196 RepID=A0A286CYM8_9GAMM|nr:beta-lactamase class A [Pseudoxanthomonas wuyuanensis]
MGDVAEEALMLRFWLRVSLAAWLLTGTSPAGQAAQAPAPPARPADDSAAILAPSWAPALQARLQAVEKRFSGRIGVYLHHLGRNESLSYHADEPWYLASGVKVPVAIAVLREVEQGRLALDTRVRLQESDFVDGAGQTNSYPAGTRLRVSFLLEQMIIHSDNTASDALIRTVGLDQVNSVATELLATNKLIVTSLSDVRRLTYAMFDPRAAGLSSQQLLALRRTPAGEARVRQLATILGVSAEDFLLPDLDSAFEAYYATEVNTAPLSDFGRMLATLSDGLALNPEGTAYLLNLMSRVKTGEQRIKARLPVASRFAHKTGTQHRRVCDLGIVATPVGRRQERVVIAACARGGTQAAGERALREIAAAVTASGLWTLPSPTGRVPR